MDNFSWVPTVSPVFSAWRRTAEPGHLAEGNFFPSPQAEKTQEVDIRIPWPGYILRRTNLDEYPQFLNVLFGSMSTVGPRPHMVGEDKILEHNVPRYRIRRFVKPGITGWAAINGYRGGTDNIKLMTKRLKSKLNL